MSATGRSGGGAVSDSAVGVAKAGGIITGAEGNGPYGIADGPLGVALSSWQRCQRGRASCPWQVQCRILCGQLVWWQIEPPCSWACGARNAAQGKTGIRSATLNRSAGRRYVINGHTIMA